MLGSGPILWDVRRSMSKSMSVVFKSPKGITIGKFALNSIPKFHFPFTMVLYPIPKGTLKKA